MAKLIKGKDLFASIKSLIEEARSSVVRQVNTTMVYAYFNVGKMIVENEQHGNNRADYSKATLKQLSISLTGEFGKGYSVDNLQLMRAFFLEYRCKLPQKDNRIIQKAKYETVSRISNFPFSLSWSHYVQLLKIKDKNERDFYEIESCTNDWSVRELQRQFNAALYERLALSKDKKGIKKLAQKEQILECPTDALKSHYVLDFLNLKEDGTYSESELETAVINKIEQFMHKN